VASFPQVSPIKTLYTPLPSPIRATCPAYLILLDLITRTKLGEQYRLLSSSLCSYLHFSVSSSLLGPNTLLNTLFSNPSAYVSPSMSATKFHTHTKQQARFYLCMSLSVNFCIATWTTNGSALNVSKRCLTATINMNIHRTPQQTVPITRVQWIVRNIAAFTTSTTLHSTQNSHRKHVPFYMLVLSYFIIIFYILYSNTQACY